MKQKQKITIGILVVVAAVAYLIISGFNGNTGYQKTIAQVADSGSSLDGAYVLVEGGKLVGSSVNFDSKNIVLTFKVTDGTKEMPVIYNGIAPDNFEDEADVILKGSYDSEKGVFKADTVETRCPSKYEAAEEK
ncbi:MAG: cytochrome c maturation protein CcmE [Bacillota bacterium]